LPATYGFSGWQLFFCIALVKSSPTIFNADEHIFLSVYVKIPYPAGRANTLRILFT
jgi:hypothetical protein